MHIPEVQTCFGMTETSPIACRYAPTTQSSGASQRSAASTRTSRSRFLIRRRGRSICVASRCKSLTRGYAVKSRLSGITTRRRSAPSTAQAGCALPTWRLMDVQGYAQGRRAGCKDMVICGGENSIRASSRSSSTAIPRSATCRWLACLTRQSVAKSDGVSDPREKGSPRRQRR